MPGVRLEGREYDLGGTTGVPDLKTTNLFPSLHVERQFAQWLTGTASYSRRITYPAIQQLNPALNFQDATTAQAGNPLLRPQFTDSYEAPAPRPGLQPQSRAHRLPPRRPRTSGPSAAR